MENLTTPFKATVIAFLSAKLVHVLGMGDADASYVATAAWMLLTAGIAYVVPKDFGSGAAAWVLARILKLRMGAVVFAIGAAGLLGGCSAQRDQAADCAAARGYLSQAEAVVEGLCASVTSTTLPPQ